MRALIVNAEGPAGLTDLESADGDALRVLVGGWLEGVSTGSDGWHAYVNEEGKLLGLPVNLAATRLAIALGWPPADILVGNVVFLGDGAGGEEAAVPEVVVARAQDLGLIAKP
jgi:hypothetical protein